MILIRWATFCFGRFLSVTQFRLVRKLQSLDVWKVAVSTAVDSYRLTLEPSLRRHFALTDQIRRSAISIPANISEGYGLGTRPQLFKHLRIAIGSTYELRTHLLVLASLKLVPASTIGPVTELVDRCTALLLGTHRGLQRSNK